MTLIRATFPMLGMVLAACASLGAKEPSSPDLDCPDPGSGAYFFTMEPRSLEAGATMTLQPYFSAYPGMIEGLPAACLTDVKIDNPDSGSINMNERGEPFIVVSDDAREGVVQTVSAMYGQNSVTGRFSVFNPDTDPLVGRWSQSQDDCDPEAAINELVFNADGTFSVTWMPFEGYKDYWGQYEFDPESSALTLSVESGNDIPDNVRSGKIRFTDAGFELMTASFGTRQNGPNCPIPDFVR